MRDKLTLNIVVSNAILALEFYEKVFNGTRGEVYHFTNRTGENEANVTIGNVAIRLIDENSDYGCHPPETGKTDSIWLQIIVDDTDATLKKAMANGAAVSQKPSEFMGTRYAEITDPFGYTWTINQILREVSFEERYIFYEEQHKEKDKEKQLSE